MREAAPLLVRAQTALILLAHLFRGVALELWARARGKSDEPLNFANIWQRHVYARVADCWTHVVRSAPGARITMDAFAPALNFGSYNYLGLNAPSERVFEVLRRLEGETPQNVAALSRVASNEVELRVAAFVGVEQACVFASGFATNAAAMQALLGGGPRNPTLVLSDERAHASLVAGRRLAGPSCLLKTFRHNDLIHLEQLVREAALKMPERTIVVVTEGVFSMDGTLAPLAAIVEMRKRTRVAFRVWLDEAHSLGALGARGRGACEHWGVDAGEIDFLVGTFSKTFGGVGGFVGGTARTISALRGAVEARPLNAVVCRHVCDGLDVLESARGPALVARLHANVALARTMLAHAGLHVLGAAESAVVPVLICHPTRLVAFHRALLARGVAVIIVGYPATAPMGARARLCISAAHTLQEVEWAMREIVAVARETGVL
jgi:serine palmitoyltransferase